MSFDNAIQVVLKFEALINGRNADAIVALMTGDAEFIDSLGNSLRGGENLRSAWAAYFKMVPDYSISHSEIFADGNTVAVFGSAQGNVHKRRPAHQGKYLEDSGRLARRSERQQDRSLARLCRQ
jgi:ketosteroid isomerase-like protein